MELLVNLRIVFEVLLVAIKFSLVLFALFSLPIILISVSNRRAEK